jgi:hypothetical protein
MHPSCVHELATHVHPWPLARQRWQLFMAVTSWWRGWRGRYSFAGLPCSYAMRACSVGRTAKLLGSQATRRNTINHDKLHELYHQRRASNTIGANRTCTPRTVTEELRRPSRAASWSICVAHSVLHESTARPISLASWRTPVATEFAAATQWVLGCPVTPLHGGVSESKQGSPWS